MPDLVSVVIPAHNRAGTIGYCLESILAQTYPHFEIVVVDDGSTDDTCKVVQSFQDARIRLLSHPSAKGAQAARNTGIRAAAGRWIAFQDSDDEWLPEKLGRQMNVLEDAGWNEHVVVHADMYRFTPTTGEREHWILPRVAGNDTYRTVLTAPGPVFPTIVASKAALLEVGLLDENVPSYQEWDTAIRLARVCRFEHIQEPLAVYWLHAGETISKSKRREIDGFRYVASKHRDEIIRVAGAKAWYAHVAGLARRCGYHGFFDEAWAVLRDIPWSSALKWRALAYLFCLKTGLRSSS